VIPAVNPNALSLFQVQANVKNLMRKVAIIHREKSSPSISLFSAHTLIKIDETQSSMWN
jgi:hypothetical protein